MSENELRLAFRELTDGVKAQADPYTRLRGRGRRRRRARTAGFTAAVAACLAALLFSPIGLPGAAGPIAQAKGGNPITQWIQRYLDAPGRGALAADTEFASELAQQVSRRNVGELAGQPAKLLFADDVGELRMAVLARYTATHYSAIYLSGPRGAGIAELTDERRQRWSWNMLMPYVSVGYTEGYPLRAFGVSLVPPGCVLSTANSQTGELAWRESPLRDYLLWPDDAPAHRARITCDGVGRYEGSLVKFMHTITNADMDPLVRTASAGMRGAIPQTAAEGLLLMASDPWPIGPVRILYGGLLPGTTQTVYVAINPIYGGWKYQIRGEAPRSGPSGTTAANLGAPDAILMGNPINQAGPERTLILAPAGAVKLELLDPSGTVRETVPLTDGVGSMLTPQGEFRLRALDASGNQVGKGEFPLASLGAPVPGPTASSNWN